MNLSKNAIKHLIPVTFISTLTAITIMGGSVLAQEKGAERLLNLQRSSASRVVTGEHHGAMSCPKCKDVAVLTSDAKAKGGEALISGGRPTKAIARHQCGTCATTLKTEAQGKASQTVAQHFCASAGMSAMSGCSSNGKASPTPVR